MAKPIVEKIGAASKEAWPLVSASVAVTMRKTEELAQIAGQAVPMVEDYFQNGDGATMRRRKICEETIWVLAQLGWLRTGGERDVILAAKDWVDVDPDETDQAVIDTADDQLIDAVKALPEYMTARSNQEA